MENDDTAIKVVMDTEMIDIHEMLRNVENPPFVDQFLWKLWGVQKVQDCSISSSVSPGWLLKHIRIVHGKSGWARSCSCWLILAAFPPKCGWLTSIHTGRLEHANVTKMSLLDRCPQNRDALGILGNFHGNFNRFHIFLRNNQCHDVG